MNFRCKRGREVPLGSKEKRKGVSVLRMPYPEGGPMCSNSVGGGETEKNRAPLPEKEKGVLLMEKLIAPGGGWAVFRHKKWRTLA